MTLLIACRCVPYDFVDCLPLSTILAAEYHTSYDFVDCLPISISGLMLYWFENDKRQACPVAEFGFCIGVVLAYARTVQVVVITLHEMECVKPLNPTYFSPFQRFSSIFLIIHL